MCIIPISQLHLISIGFSTLGRNNSMDGQDNMPAPSGDLGPIPMGDDVASTEIGDADGVMDMDCDGEKDPLLISG